MKCCNNCKYNADKCHIHQVGGNEWSNETDYCSKFIEKENNKIERLHKVTDRDLCIDTEMYMKFYRDKINEIIDYINRDK